MKKMLFVLVVVLASCESQPLPQKPYIIIYKNPNSGACSKNYCRYEYQSANGRVISFCDYESKYNIGDTIK